MILDYEDTYMAWRDDELARLERLKPKSGAHVQDLSLYDTDESQLTERERLIMIMSVVIYEMDNDMLTEEICGELDYYHEMLTDGKLEGMFAENEEAEAISDIERYYAIAKQKHLL